MFFVVFLPQPTRIFRFLDYPKHDYSSNIGNGDANFDLLRTAFRSRVKLEYRLVFSFTYFTCAKKSSFSVAMILRTERHKILVRTRGKHIDMKLIPFVFEFTKTCSICLQIASKNDELLRT